MIVALIDNGSLEPAAHRNLRGLARALSAQCGTLVHAVSWKHSDRIDPAALDGAPAWSLDGFVRAMHALGQREYLFVPFFISPQGAIGSALRRDLDRLQAELGGFDLNFTDGLAQRGVLADILVSRIRDVAATRSLATPNVVVVDHGGPSPASAAVRDEIASATRRTLAGEIGALIAASMEGEHPPLLADVLARPEFAGGDVIVAPLFLSPGRHAGPEGDVAQICAASPSRCHFAELIGTHPLAAETLAAALQNALSQLHAHSSA